MLYSRHFSGSRSGRDSNPRGVAPKRFSRPPRYDHFDTAAYDNTDFYRCAFNTVSQAQRFFKNRMSRCFTVSFKARMRTALSAAPLPYHLS